MNVDSDVDLARQRFLAYRNKHLLFNGKPTDWTIGRSSSNPGFLVVIATAVVDGVEFEKRAGSLLKTFQGPYGDAEIDRVLSRADENPWKRVE